MEEKITSETFKSNSLRMTAIYWVSNRLEEHFRTILQVMSFRSHQKLTQRGTYLLKSHFPPIPSILEHFFPTYRWKSVLSASLCELPCASHNNWIMGVTLLPGKVGSWEELWMRSCRWLCSSSRVLGFSWNWCHPAVKTVAMESLGSQIITFLLRTSSIVITFQILIDGHHCHSIFHLGSCEGSIRSKSSKVS